MQKWIITLMAVVGLTLGQNSHAAQKKWQVDKAHTTIGFKVKHLGISTVRGKFTTYQAAINADDATGKISWLKATAKAASINTDNGGRDKHLKSPDFLDAAKFPNLVLETVSIKWNGDDFSGTAKLTIKGSTKKVPFKGSLTGLQKANFGGKASLRAGYEVRAKINRQEFGLTFNALAEGVSVVSDEVTLNFEAEVFLPL